MPHSRSQNTYYRPHPSAPSLPQELALYKNTTHLNNNQYAVDESRLRVLPVAIPQVAPGAGVPFMRAYCSLLAQHRVAEQDFIKFIDGLNTVVTSSPPLKVLDLVGGGLSMVPHHWAVLAGHGISISAKVGMVALSKGQTEHFLDQMNADYFGPRRLKVLICTADALRHKIGMPANARVVETRQPGLMPGNPQSVQQWRMHALRGYVGEIRETALPLTAQESTLSKLSSKQVARDVAKLEVKMVKESEKAAKKQTKAAKKGKTHIDGSIGKEEKAALKLRYILIEPLDRGS